MSKLTIELDPKTHQILKECAARDERSLTQYIQRTLRQHAGTLNTNPTTNNTDSTTDQTPKSQPKKRIIGDEPTTQSTPTTSTPTFIPHNTPGGMQTPVKSTPIQNNKEEQLKQKLEIWLETWGISVTDHSSDTFNRAKEALEQVYGRELKMDEYNYFIFDEVQHRREDQQNNGKQK